MESRSQEVSPQLIGLGVADAAASWSDAGFKVADQTVSIGQLTVSLGVDPAWSFEPRVDGQIDGILGATSSSGPEQSNPNGTNMVDHVVVMSPDLARTTGAFESAGFPMRKSRSVGDREQRFFWAGTTIIELVGPVVRSGDEPANIWGLALVSDDLDASKTLLGENLSDPRAAVQPGRRIAAIRTRELGISITIALMTPHIKSP